MSKNIRQRTGNGLVTAAGELLLASALIAVWPATVWAATYTVSNLNDSGAGSLRDAISSAADGDTIAFADGLSGTITLASALPSLAAVTLENGESIALVGYDGLSSVGLKVAGSTLSGELPASITATTSTTSAYAYGLNTGTVTIDELSGSISADAYYRYAQGIYTSGDLVVTTLSGDISATADGYAHGMWAYYGASITVGTLSGSVTATVDDAGAYGFRSQGTMTLGTLTETGLISATANTFATAIEVSGDLTVTDLSGTVQAIAKDHDAYGIYGSGVMGTVNIVTLSGAVTAKATNDAATAIGGLNAVTLGTLSASGRVSATAGGDGAYGILASYGDLIVSDLSGTVSVSAGGDTAYGLYSESTTLTLTDLTETGVVSVTAGGSDAYGIYSGDAIKLGSLSGTVDVSAGSSGAYGIYSSGTLDDGSGGAAEISGTVSAEANGLAVAVSAAKGMNLSVTGTLSATDTSGSGEAYAIAAGTVSGGSWSTGGAYDDTVTLGDGASVTGNIDLGGGTNLLTLLGTGTLIGDITNITTLTKSGSGTWSTTGSITTDTLNVSDGTLVVNVTQTATPTVTVTGTATNDGVISFALDGTISTGTFTVLDAGSLAGSGTYTTASAFLSATVDTVNSDVLLTKLSFSDAFAGSDSNTRKLAAAIDANYATADAELSDLISAVEGTSTRAQANAAMDELSALLLGQRVKTNVAIAQFQTLATQFRMAGVRARQTADGSLDPMPQIAAHGDISGLFAGSPGGDPNGLYLNIVGRGGSMDSQGGQSGYDYRSVLFSGGFDRLVSDNLLAGVSVGYASTGIDFDDDGGSETSNDTYTLGVYASLFDQVWYVDGLFSAAYNSDNTDRELRALSATASSESDGYSLSAKVESGYRFDLGGYALTPAASLEYIHLHQDGYTETGAGAANQVVGDYNANFLESGIGARVSRVWRTDYGLLAPEISAMWTHEWLSPDRNVTYSLTGLPGTMLSQTLSRTLDDALSLGASLRYVTDDGVALTGRYQGKFEPYGSSHSLLAEIRYAF
ncbi:autotransporter domain-containing protein [Breoghania sp.]|uniref:autotransporter outer membrane beta-barrel domain-containing protein n=1 Tax=Breoghania sp. TaxID=2065378 RepID=UPI002AA6183B|nr:autotransporter domain-containing protein [Breoghania sp.]